MIKLKVFMYSSIVEKIYRRLLKQKNALQGGTVFRLGELAITIKSKDGVGKLIEEWLGIWMMDNGFLCKDRGSQDFPDYWVQDNETGELAMLEIKSFNDNASPAFDIANFRSYCESITKTPERCCADYLIISYSLSLPHFSRQWLKLI
jgi:hypothetical protein